MTERIKRFILYRVVTASVREVAENRVYVLGHVEKPKEYRANRQLDVLQTLSLAGGVTVQPNEMDIMIIRYKNGHQKVYSLNYSGIMGGLGLEAKIILRSGDTVIVPGGFWQ